MTAARSLALGILPWFWQPTDVIAPALKGRSDLKYSGVGAWNVRSMKNRINDQSQDLSAIESSSAVRCS